MMYVMMMDMILDYKYINYIYVKMYCKKLIIKIFFYYIIIKWTYMIK